MFLKITPHCSSKRIASYHRIFRIYDDTDNQANERTTMAHRPSEKQEEQKHKASLRKGGDRNYYSYEEEKEAFYSHDSFVDNGFRNLYGNNNYSEEEEESSSRRLGGGSQTLWFSTATSNFSVKRPGGLRTAYAGIYQCTLEEDNNFDDFNDGDEDRETCHYADFLGDWTTFDGAKHHELILRNLQFDLSSSTSTKDNNKRWRKNQATKTKTKKKNYLYATTHTTITATEKVIEANPSYDDDLPVPFTRTSIRPDWEILRAELPSGDTTNDDSGGAALNPDGSLRFESFFRTNATIASWNECDSLRCCTRTDRDENYDARVPWWGDRDPADVKHAYAQTTPRSYAVDETTGDVFVSWEGFYKDCTAGNNNNDDDDDDSERLRWTVGISRLKTEDPGCVLRDRDEDDDYFDESVATRQRVHYFPLCTEPVAIAHRSSSGRDMVLPHGGFLVVPASRLGESPLRTFLLSVLENKDVVSYDNPTKVTASVLSVPEGHNGMSHADIRAEAMSSEVDGRFWNAEPYDGGSLRLHHDPITGHPDHLCWSAYDRGISCRKVWTTEHKDDGTPILYFPGFDEVEIEPFLSPEQTAVFCKQDKSDDDEDDALPPFVAGFDVRWEDDGRPERVYFGCGGSGGKGGARVHRGSGTLGSVGHGGTDLRRVLDGAFAGSVVFLPSALEGTTDPAVVAAAAASRAASVRGSAVGDHERPGWIILPVLLLVTAVLAVYRRRNRSSSWQQQHQTPTTWFSVLLRKRPMAMRTPVTPSGFRTPYVELQNLESSSPTSSSSPGLEL